MINIKLLTSIPDTVYLACSGGVDSIGAYHFLQNHGKRKIIPLFFNHGTETSQKALDFLLAQGYNPTVGSITRNKDKGESWEEYWRNERYKFFGLYEDLIITCHHLDDAIESWIFSSIHGEGKLIPIQNKNVIRPFLITPKQKFKDICIEKGISWIEDETNKDLSYSRNRIRYNIIPEILKINPGIDKVIKKKYLLQLNERKNLGSSTN